MRQAEWSAEQYLKFEDERTRPAKDLLAAVPVYEPGHVVDLGCGPGNSTALLVERFSGAAIEGIDTSEDMLAKARQRLPGCSFTMARIDEWQPSVPVGLLYANASMQWLHDHETLFPQLMTCLENGGSLAIQMPDNLGEPAHLAMREVAAMDPWAQRLHPVSAARQPLPSAGRYYEMLKPFGRRVDVWRTIYHHPLAGIESIIDWFKGSALAPYLAALDEAERKEFLAIYAGKLAEAYRVLEDGTVLLPFPRLFIVATR